MAHWAEIDSNSRVLRVTVGDNAEQDEGLAWITANLGGTWAKTSYNTYGGQHLYGGTPLRYNYAGEGYTFSTSPEWDTQGGAFIPPQPYPSWTLNADTALWDAPSPMPADGRYRWEEPTLSWVEVVA